MALSLVIILVGLGFVGGVWGAEGTLDKISRTGKFVVGARTDAEPFGFIDKSNNWVGFSIDLCSEVKNRLEAKLNKKIELELKAVTPANRLQLVADGTIDIECGSTTHTQQRDETVDFSINFFYTGAQLLARKGSGIRSVVQLDGKRVGVVQGTTTEGVVRKVATGAQIVYVQGHPAGFQALEQGGVDVYTTDGVILAGLLKASPNAANYEIVGDPFTNEPYSFVVREDDSKWHNFVDHMLMAMLKDGTHLKLQDKWLGPQGVVPYAIPAIGRAYLVMQAIPK
jgi:ABC-type amino acid transport substrate-binding protein